MKFIFSKIVFLYLLMLSSFVAYTQTVTIDSLKMALQNEKEDTNKVNTYAALLWEYQWNAPDSTLAYSLPALQLARKLDFTKGEIRILHSMGEALASRGDFSQSLTIQFKALKLAKMRNNINEILTAYVWVAAVYYYSKDYANALLYFKKANQKKFSFRENPELMLSFLGETYFHLNKLDSAYWYLKKAYDLDIQNKTYHNPVPYAYLGALYEKKGDYGKAIGFYRAGLKIDYTKLAFLNSYNNLASAFKKSGQQDSAVFYAKKVIDNGTSFPATVIEAGKLLTDIYKAKGVTDSAFKYQELTLATKDSLFDQEKVRQLQNLTFSEQLRQQEAEAAKWKLINRIRIYSLVAALIVFLSIAFLLWRNNRQKQQANVLLTRQKEKVETTLAELRATQAQLIQSEKMASLGELAAGIAHEIQNPLNFVNNFSEVNVELIEELKREKSKAKSKNGELEDEILNDIEQNLQKILNHGKRADVIVKGMLQHSRTSTGQKEPTDMNALCDEYLRLSYQAIRSKDKSFTAVLETHFDNSIGKINVVPQDIGRVLLNLFNNAFYAVQQKKQNLTGTYEPVVSISTKKLNDKIEITVKDNGIGIHEKIKDKIFQPFFTTKPTGQGTGLGLSLSYDIIKAQGGEIKVESKEGEYAEFIFRLPV